MSQYLAIDCIDRLFEHFPDFDSFNTYSLAQNYNPTIASMMQHNRELATSIDTLLTEKFLYATRTFTGIGHLALTPLGREVKKVGGHSAYVQIQTTKEIVEKERQQRKDKAEKIDLRLKQWQVKTKYLPYIVSILALTVSIFSYFKQEKKQADLQEVQKGLLQLQDRAKSLDSLLQSDTLLRRHK